MQLITGHRGFVGSRLLKRLPDALVLDKKDGTNLLNCNLPDDVDVVYHLAAHKDVAESWNEPLVYNENLLTLMRLVQKYPDAKIIHASSCAGDQPETSPYAFFKKAASDYLRMFHTNYIDLVFPNIFGGLQKQNSVVDIFKTRDTLVVDDPTIVRDYVHVEDIATGLVKASKWAPGVYSMGSGVPITTLQLAEATGKSYTIGSPRSGGKEPKESIVPNTTPDWVPLVDVLEYIHG